MDADQLRLILLMAGMTLVVAIYLWDRYKRSRTRLKGLSLRQARRLQRELADLEPASQEEVPSFTAVPENDLSEPQVTLVTDETEPKPEELDVTVEAAPAQVPEAESASFSAAVEDDYLHSGPEAQKDAPQLLLQIALVSREGEFQGGDIQLAMKDANLQPGAMDIYHRHDDRYPDRVLFSVANMVNPGTFPFKDMENFSSPGLLLFSQLPGVRDGMEIYADMLYAANELAGILGGVLQDETHSVLSKQTIQHTRDAIMEHRRKLRLAKLHK